MSPTPKVIVRRPLSRGEHIFLIGPGGVGKSTLARQLSHETNWPIIDLDLEFCDRIGIIGPFIDANGYDAYRAANLQLAIDLVAALTRPTLFVTASGFLAAPPGSADYQQAMALVQSGYSLTLLPSLDPEEATGIVVDRQMTRGYTSDRVGETEKFQRRFPIYRDKGDMLVVSTAPPQETAKAVIAALGVPIVGQTPTAPAAPARPQ